MWTAEQQTRHKVRVPKERKGYPTDMSDQEWKLVEPLLPGAARTGRPHKTDLGQVLNAFRYLVRSGCEWACCRTIFHPTRLSTTGPVA